MHVVVASDHAGYELKQNLVVYLVELGHAVQDVGAYDTRPSDYPDYAEALCLAILDGRAARGILLCGSGVGASVAANKLPDIRAAVCHDVYSAHQGVEHDDMNVMVLGSRVVASALARDLVKAFLDARFSGAERHRRRLAKIDRLEDLFAERRRARQPRSASDEARREDTEQKS